MPPLCILANKPGQQHDVKFKKNDAFVPGKTDTYFQILRKKGCNHREQIEKQLSYNVTAVIHHSDIREFNPYRPITASYFGTIVYRSYKPKTVNQIRLPGS